MPIESSEYRSPYSNGEARALIAPMLGASAEDLGEFIIIARAKDGEHLGVFHTMYCQIEGHAHCQALDLIAEWIRDTAARLYEIQPQHGPGEG